MRDWLGLGFTVACTAIAWLAFGDRALELSSPFALRLAHPAALGLLGALPWLLARQRGNSAGGALGVALRAGCWIGLVLALCRPERVEASARVSLVVAVDVSASLTAPALARAQAQLRTLERALGDRTGDELQVVTFAREARPLATGAPLARHSAASGGATPGADAGADQGTDLQAALRLAYRLFEPERVSNLLLITDGNQTRGDLAAEAERAARLGIRIDYLRAENPAEPADVAVRSLSFPRDLALGVPFKLRAIVSAERPGPVEIRLFRSSSGNDPAALEQTRALELVAGETNLELEARIDEPGRVEFRLELQPKAADRWPDNNRAAVATELAGPAKVLIVDSEPLLAASLARALRERDFEVDVRPPSAAPRRDADLTDYAFVVLSDLPARELRPDTLSVLRRYVEELGGGLLVAGGTQGFGLQGYQGSALERLLPVRGTGEEERDQASLALALIIDCSGSMAGSKLELAREAADLTAQTLADADLIEVIGFSSQPERRVRLQAAGNRASIAQSIARLAASGGTQLYPALDAAYRDLRAADARLKHAILLTDGQTQEAGIEDLASSLRADGITLSTVGLGEEVNRSLLETLAGLGGGRAYFPQDARNVPQIFMSEASRHKRPTALDQRTRAYEREHAGFLDRVALSGAPPLGGYVTTVGKPRPAQIILETERGDPLLARWRVGLGYALAWTSDLKPRWAASWLRWPGFGRFVAQLAREHMRVPDLQRVPLTVRLDDDRARVIADVLGSDDRFDNQLEASVQLRSSAGEVAASPMRQIAPARYEAELQIPSFGAFTLDASFRRAGALLAAGQGQIARTYAAEYAFSSPNTALLSEVARGTGGRELSDPRHAFGAGTRRSRVRDALWPYLIGIALALFLFDQYVRHARSSGKKPAPGREGGSRSV